MHLARKQWSGDSAKQGAAEANGNLIAFLDADDVWLTEKLEEQARVLSKNPKIGWVHSDFWFVDVKTGEHSLPRHIEGLFLGECYGKLFLQGCGIHISTVIVRKECLTAVGGFDERIRKASAEDYDLWIRLSRHFELGYVDCPLALYQVHSSNASKQRLAMLEAVNYVLKKALGDDPELPNVLGRRVVRNRLFDLYFSIGFLHHDGSRSLEARTYLAQAIRQRWTDPYAWTLYAANLLPANLAQTLRSLKRQLARPIA